MKCPACGSPSWKSVEKNKDGVNMRVKCIDCATIYRTKFSTEPVEYRLKDESIQ